MYIYKTILSPFLYISRQEALVDMFLCMDGSKLILLIFISNNTINLFFYITVSSYGYST